MGQGSIKGESRARCLIRLAANQSSACLPDRGRSLFLRVNRSPDIEAEITFLSTEEGGRKVPALSGYRPAHRVSDDYLTTGVHTYSGCDAVLPGQTALGSITFITPEAYSHCLWIGREIDMQEGSRVVGRVKITKIMNPLLQKRS